MSGAEPVGSLAEEAERLAEAVQQWARRQSAGGSPLRPESPGCGHDRERGWSERIAAEAPECQICPVCQVVSLLRGTRPEVVEHLADAATSVAAALQELLAAHERSRESGPSGRVEHIDIG